MEMTPEEITRLKNALLKLVECVAERKAAPVETQGLADVARVLFEFDQSYRKAGDMPDRYIKTSLKLEGGEQYLAEVNAICADLKHLSKCIETVNDSVTQLNQSFGKLIELRKQASLL